MLSHKVLFRYKLLITYSSHGHKFSSVLLSVCFTIFGSHRHTFSHSKKKILLHYIPSKEKKNYYFTAITSGCLLLKHLLQFFLVCANNPVLNSAPLHEQEGWHALNTECRLNRLHFLNIHIDLQEHDISVLQG